MNRLLSVIAIGLYSMVAMAQHSYMSAPGVAVFYPENYDASAHAPSPIFERELYPIGAVPEDWKIRPVYSQAGNEQIVTLHVGDEVDLYGGGEVWGSLLRNGKTIEFWNMDNPFMRTPRFLYMFT